MICVLTIIVKVVILIIFRFACLYDQHGSAISLVCQGGYAYHRGCQSGGALLILTGWINVDYGVFVLGVHNTLY